MEKQGESPSLSLSLTPYLPPSTHLNSIAHSLSLFLCLPNYSSLPFYAFNCVSWKWRERGAYSPWRETAVIAGADYVCGARDTEPSPWNDARQTAGREGALVQSRHRAKRLSPSSPSSSFVFYEGLLPNSAHSQVGAELTPLTHTYTGTHNSFFIHVSPPPLPQRLPHAHGVPLTLTCDFRI